MWGSGIHISDLETGEDWKDRKAEWWDAHGARLVIRVQKAWKTQAGGVGMVTDAIIRGQVLSKLECEEVVDDARIGLDLGTYSILTESFL